MSEQSPYQHLEHLALEEHPSNWMGISGFALWLAAKLDNPLPVLFVFLHRSPPSKFSRKETRAAYGRMLADLFSQLFSLPMRGTE